MDRRGVKTNSSVLYVLIILINILICIECSPVVLRQQWGAVRPTRRTLITGPVRKVIIHHTAVQSCRTLAACKRQLVSIQRTHMTVEHFDDIGYNFLVAGDGTVFEGRGWGVVGEHAKGHNSNSVGIAFMGTFNSETPSRAALTAVKQLLQTGVSRRSIQSPYTVYGHRDVGSTECPGRNLYAVLSQLRK